MKQYDFTKPINLKCGTKSLLSMLFAIVSCGSILLLTMTATKAGVIKTGILFLIGLVLIVFKKTFLEIRQLAKEYLIASVAMVLFCSLHFYERWLPSSIVEKIANIAHIPLSVFLTVVTLGVAILSVYSIANILQLIEDFLVRIEKNRFLKDILCCLLMSIITVAISQIIIDTLILSMGIIKYLWATLIVFVTICFIYCVIGEMKISLILGTGIFVIISIINAYLYSFRERLFEPVDILSVRTAMNVADSYSLWPIPKGVIIGLVIWALCIGRVIRVCLKGKYYISIKRRIAVFLSVVIGAVSISVYTMNLKTHHWRREGAVVNGYVLDFVSKFKEAYVSSPGGYSKEKIEVYANKYALDNKDDNKQPNIIVIMDEAFSNLDVLGEISTNKEVMPFISSMKEDVIKGYVLTSVYGGNTANSEYEFLTGNSMAWMSPNVVPYQQYVSSPSYSMVSYLKKHYNYNCIAMHPYLSSGWNRPNTYNNFGFDESLFVEDFPQKDYIRDFISDGEMFEKIIDTYENKQDNPLFIFGVTMQNHGGYNYSDSDFKQSVFLEGYDEKYPEAEQYLSLINETDKAVESLVSYFDSVNEEVIIVFFGDHQPTMNDDFYDAIGYDGIDDFEEQQKMYKVPFFIWTNYDIDEKEVECTSLNYLSSYVYEAAGISMPVYNRFLSDMEEKVPAINANGFYSSERNKFLNFEEASKEELDWLNKYEQLQYNNVFDKKNRNKKLFPILE